MKNFEVTSLEDHKKYWISRSIAVVIVPVIIDKRKKLFSKYSDIYFLAETRGPGCPDNIGKLVFPCGYLDFDETLKDAAIREVYEETGLELNPEDVHFSGINDSPSTNRQNVTIRFVVVLDKNDIQSKIDDGTINIRTDERGGEPNEVSNIEIVSVNNLYSRPDNWAFDHDKLGKTVAKNIKKIIENKFVSI